MGCSNSKLHLEVIKHPEYPYNISNCQQFLESIEENGCYRIFQENPITIKFNKGGEQIQDKTLFLFSPISCQLEKILINFDFTSNSFLSSNQLSVNLLLLRKGVVIENVEMPFPSDSSKCSFDFNKQNNNPLILNSQAGDVLKLTIPHHPYTTIEFSNFSMICEGKNGYTTHHMLFEESVGKNNKHFVIQSFSPWIWFASKRKSFDRAWINTSPLLESCRDINISMDLKIDTLLSKQFYKQTTIPNLSATFSLILFRNAKIIKECPIAIICGSHGITKKINLSISSLTNSDISQLVKLSQPGDQYIITRNVFGPFHGRLLMKNFRFELIGHQGGCCSVSSRFPYNRKVPTSNAVGHKRVKVLGKKQSSSLNTKKIPFQTKKGSQDSGDNVGDAIIVEDDILLSTNSQESVVEDNHELEVDNGGDGDDAFTDGGDGINRDGSGDSNDFIFYDQIDLGFDDSNNDWNDYLVSEGGDGGFSSDGGGGFSSDGGGFNSDGGGWSNDGGEVTSDGGGGGWFSSNGGGWSNDGGGNTSDGGGGWFSSDGGGNTSDGGGWSSDGGGFSSSDGGGFSSDGGGCSSDGGGFSSSD